MSVVLNVAGMTKRFGGVTASQDVTFAVETGQMVAIIGPNGAGKSTVFNMIGGQIRPDAGEVELLGRTILGLPPRAIWRRGVGRTFQITATFPSMTVLENVQMVIVSSVGATRRLWVQARDLHKDRALEALERVGMADQAERPCSELAYGDLKRVELAVALTSDPALLLMDEPTAGMAPKERFALMDLVASIARDDGLAVLFTEHDIDVVFKHAEHIIVLERGEIIARGDPEAVRMDPKVRQVYLGDGFGGTEIGGSPT